MTGTNFIEKNLEKIFIIFASILAIGASIYFFQNDLILSYGDAESHINIAKRVISSITPGLAQLGGIWLPLPHILLIPFVAIEPLYRTGLAGAAISGIAYVISAIYMYKITYSITFNKKAGALAFLIFALNPNILFLQSTPMTEMLLISFFILSTYYFIEFLKKKDSVGNLMLASLFAFAASLSRYEGWFLVGVQAGIIILLYATKKEFNKLQAYFIFYSTLGFFGIVLWLLWDFILLGDPLYFTNSEFSAQSQQQNWSLRGELPAQGDIIQSFLYYFVTSLQNVGIVLFLYSLIGLGVFVAYKFSLQKIFIALLFLVPFIFHTLTLFMGQSVIFIPALTPKTFEWQLFNVRYGVMMIPFSALFFAYMFSFRSHILKGLAILLLIAQVGFYAVQLDTPITIEDGRTGLSHAKRPYAQEWIKQNYDTGLVLLDDYARTISIVKSDIPMDKTIYIGNKPYWQESLEEPEKHAVWIIMQRGDSVWKNIYENEKKRGRLYTHFERVYTSPDILIFRKPKDLTQKD